MEENARKRREATPEKALEPNDYEAVEGPSKRSCAKWVKRAGLAAACVIVAACFALAALSAGGRSGAGTQGSTPTPAEAQGSAVTVLLEAEGGDDDLTNAKVSVTGGAEKIEAEVEVNLPVKLGVLPTGVYELRVTGEPVAGDGRLYQAPDPARIVVNGDGEPVEVKLTLTVVAAESMTAEQTETAAAALEEAGKGEAAASVRAAASTAQQAVDGGRASGTNRDGGASSQGEPAQQPDAGTGPDANVPTSTPEPEPAPTPEPEPAPEPEPPAHVHYYEPIMGDMCWCGTPNPSPSHMKDHRLAGQVGPDGTNNVQNNVVVGYRPCSCGAEKQ